MNPFPPIIRVLLLTLAFLCSLLAKAAGTTILMVES